MIDIIDFPASSLKIRNPAVAPFYLTRPKHEATNGMQRSPGVAGAQWRLKFDVLVHDEASVRTLRAFFFNMEADSSLVRIAIPDRYGIDGPYTDTARNARLQYPNGIPFATGAMYETGVGHAIPTRETTFSAAAALNARTIYVSEDDPLPAGCAVSIDGFVYGIAGAWVESGQQRLKISPVLRKAASTGSVISLAPKFVGSCITSGPGYEAMVNGYYGEFSLEFVEDLTRLVEDVD
jgi:hypothetical protein